MNLNSARAAWHDAYHTSRDSIAAVGIDRARWGAAIQLSQFDARSGRAANQALAGWVQSAIATLPAHVQEFGHWLYSPLAGDDQRDTAEALVFAHAYKASARMTAAKAERARYVAAGVLFRYRRINQGGQGAAPDPLPSAEAFRRWVLDWYGVNLNSSAWRREWAPFVAQCFAACDAMDRAALAPVGRLLAKLKDVA